MYQLPNIVGRMERFRQWHVEFISIFELSNVNTTFVFQLLSFLGQNYVRLIAST